MESFNSIQFATFQSVAHATASLQQHDLDSDRVTCTDICSKVDLSKVAAANLTTKFVLVKYILMYIDEGLTSVCHDYDERVYDERVRHGVEWM